MKKIKNLKTGTVLLVSNDYAVGKGYALAGANAEPPRPQAGGAKETVDDSVAISELTNNADAGNEEKKEGSDIGIPELSALSLMKRNELMKLAKQKGITLTGNEKKTELIELLEIVAAEAEGGDDVATQGGDDAAAQGGDDVATQGGDADKELRSDDVAAQGGDDKQLEEAA